MKRVLHLFWVLAVLVVLPISVHSMNIEDVYSLDCVAWENLTYRDIFITNNLAYVDGFNQQSYKPFYRKLGKNVITEDAYYTAPYSLYVEGKSPQYIKKSVNLPEKGDYFVASKVKCSRYVKGTLGVCLYNTSVGIEQKTSGFVTAAQIISERKNAGIFIGSFHSADLDGYVDDPVVVNMAIFDTAPTISQMTRLYENYVSYEKSQPRVRLPYSDSDMLEAFVDYMNDKALSIGMNNSRFNDPAGMDNLTTCEDLVRLMVYADTADTGLARFWSTDNHTVSISGVNKREHEVTSDYYSSPYLEPFYHILGVKGGSIQSSEIYNLAAILEIPNCADKLAVVALYSEGKAGAANGSRAAVKQVADAALIKYNNPLADNSHVNVCCQSAIACLIPAEGVDFDNLQILYSKNANTQRVPASISKVMTAICILDIQKDLHKSICYEDADTNIGAFYKKDFLPGEIVTYEDALYAMMINSSNVTAMALARSAGKDILYNQYGPAISKLPTDGKAEIGKRYVVEVNADGVDLAYQWYFRNAGDSHWRRSSVTDNTYDDIMTETRNGREVYCVITDAWGNKVKTDAVKLIGIHELKIISQPVDATVKMGERYCVEVVAEGDDLQYKWYIKSKGEEKFHISSVTDNTYDDVMTEARNGREVYCVITDAWGNSIRTDTATLTGIEKKELKIISQPVDATAKIGERYCVEVIAEGDDLQYKWYIKSKGEEKFHGSSVTDNTYDDVMTESRNGREVYCIVSDAWGNKIKTDTVKLIGIHELKITSQPVDATAKIGERYCVEVIAEGDDLQYKWYIKSKGEEKFHGSSVTDNTYDDVMTESRNGREVYCIVSDAWGNKIKTDTVKLIGIHELKITSQPVDATAKIGERYCVEVIAEGDDLQYKWYIKSRGEEKFHGSSVTDNTYDDVMTESRNGREVYCIVSDAWGNKIRTETARLVLVQ